MLPSSSVGNCCAWEKKAAWRLWRKKLFIGQSRLANTPVDWLQLPVDRVVEIGARVAS